MKKSRLLGAAFACVVALISTSPYASIIIYDFTGTVTDAGNIAGVSASVGDAIIGQFAYDTSTLDSNPGDTTIGDYRDFAIVPPLMVTLPSGSITFDSFTSVLVTVDTSINIAAGTPDPRLSGNNLDIDIIFSELIPPSTALATDALPSSIDLNDFNSATGAFSSFGSAGEGGDPIFFSIDTMVISIPPETSSNLCFPIKSISGKSAVICL